MLYIIEGPDKCGKSTFIDRQDITHHCEGIDEFIHLTKHLNSDYRIAIHFSSNDITPLESLRMCCAFSHICDIFMDRSWISDMVYGPVYRGEIRLEPRDEQYIIGMLQETPHIVYYFDKQIAQSDESDMFEQDKEKVQLVKFRYRQIMGRYKRTLNIYKVEAMI
jgi:thymidylate kinase